MEGLLRPVIAKLLVPVQVDLRCGIGSRKGFGGCNCHQTHPLPGLDLPIPLPHFNPILPPVQPPLPLAPISWKNLPEHTGRLQLSHWRSSSARVCLLLDSLLQLALAALWQSAPVEHMFHCHSAPSSLGHLSLIYQALTRFCLAYHETTFSLIVHHDFYNQQKALFGLQ